jgi:hypothetical protein
LAGKKTIYFIAFIKADIKKQGNMIMNKSFILFPIVFIIALVLAGCSANSPFLETNLKEGQPKYKPANGIFNYTWENTRKSNDISPQVNKVLVINGTIYAATVNGVAKSIDNGATWTIFSVTNGLASDEVADVFVSGTSIYAATNGGLSISTNNGAAWKNYFTDIPLQNLVNSVCASGTSIYAATNNGLVISRDNGVTWTLYTSANGMPPYSGSPTEIVEKVYVKGSTVYAANAGGLSISTDGGLSWTIKYSGSSIEDLYIDGQTLYAATPGGVKISINGGSTWTYCTSLGSGSF